MAEAPLSRESIFADAPDLEEALAGNMTTAFTAWAMAEFGGVEGVREELERYPRELLRIFRSAQGLESDLIASLESAYPEFAATLRQTATTAEDIEPRIQALIRTRPEDLSLFNIYTTELTVIAYEFYVRTMAWAIEDRGVDVSARMADTAIEAAEDIEGMLREGADAARFPIQNAKTIMMLVIAAGLYSIARR